MKKLAIVYDWMDKVGGVERLLLTVKDLFPNADWYTSYLDPKGAQWATKWNVHTSFIQSLPGFMKQSRILSSTLYPLAFEQFDFSQYDVVLSITSSFAKGVITKPSTKHVCYLLTPTRYLWTHQNEYLSSTLLKTIGIPMGNKLRYWDWIAAQRPDIILSLSQTVADRCKKIYGRESEVVYPPFDREYWTKLAKESKKVAEEPYYLAVGRLEKYKRFDLLVDTFNRLPTKRLVIVGEGGQKRSLQAHAGPNISFLSGIKDEELAGLYAHAEAFLMPQEEDFGYVALEAQACGCPVIAYGRGGVLETVTGGKTGMFFHEQTPESIMGALERLPKIPYNLKDREVHLKQFSKEQFTKKLEHVITS